MRNSTRLVLLATQVPIAAKMMTESGWSYYLGWALIAAIFGMLGFIVYDKSKPYSRS